MPLGHRWGGDAGGQIARGQRGGCQGKQHTSWWRGVISSHWPLARPHHCPRETWIHYVTPRERHQGQGKMSARMFKWRSRRWQGDRAVHCWCRAARLATHCWAAWSCCTKVWLRVPRGRCASLLCVHASPASLQGRGAGMCGRAPHWQYLAGQWIQLISRAGA